MAESGIPYRHYESSLLEPVHPQQTRHLEDLAVSLTSKAGQLTRGLHPIARAIARCFSAIDELLLQQPD